MQMCFVSTCMSEIYLHMEELCVPLDYPSLLFGPFGTRVFSLFCQNISLFFRSSICCSSVKLELPFNCSIIAISTSSELRPCRATWCTRSQNRVCFFLVWFLSMLNLIFSCLHVLPTYWL